MDASGKVLVVCGPTASGKSALALDLARRLGGEIVSADSMQVYSGLVIGTAALTADEAQGVPLHLTGFLSPEQPYSVAQWVDDAKIVIEGIHARGGVPVVCGGTGLYIKSLMEGTTFAPQAADPALRADLEAQWEAGGGQTMLQRLARQDPEEAARLSTNDKKRVVRALELCVQTGMTAGQRNAASHAQPPPWRALCIGLDYRSRPALYAAIERRVDGMMAAGLLDEAQIVWVNRHRYKTAAQAIGYKEFFPYFEGGAPLEDCVARLKQATRNYAKRQLTWFRGMTQIHWLDVENPELKATAASMAAAYLKEN